MADKTDTDTIRRLNDELRHHGRNGQVVITRGIQALGNDRVAAILGAVAAFDDFTPDNDPYGEHDCAAMSVEGTDLLWKIDYYDTSIEMGSPNPADPSVTRRVLTVMLTDEY